MTIQHNHNPNWHQIPDHQYRILKKIENIKEDQKEFIKTKLLLLKRQKQF